MTDIKGIKTSDGVEHKIDYESLANRLQFQLSDTTNQFEPTLEPKVAVALDFSSVIPEDGHAYLVAIRTVIDAYASGFVSVYGTVESNEDTDLYRYCWLRFKSNTSSMQAAGSTCVVAFPPNSRTLKVLNSGDITPRTCILVPCWSMKLA